MAVRRAVAGDGLPVIAANSRLESLCTPTAAIEVGQCVEPVYVRMPSCVAVVPPFSPIVKSAPLNTERMLMPFPSH